MALQVLAQERYEAIRNQESREAEWEARIAELESELSRAHRDLDRQRRLGHQAVEAQEACAQQQGEENQKLLQELAGVSVWLHHSVECENQNCLKLCFCQRCALPEAVVPIL